MGIILDIILIAIVALNLFIGYRKGLVRLAVGLLAVLVSIVLAVILYKPVSNIIIQNTEIDERIENVIIENLVTEEEEISVKEESLITYLEDYINESVNETKNDAIISMSSMIAVKLINTAVILGIFLLVRIALVIVTFITDFITELPILKQFNEVGGIVYGAIKALLIIYIVLAIVFFITYITGNNFIQELIESTFITKFFYNHNLLLTILF